MDRLLYDRLRGYLVRSPGREAAELLEQLVRYRRKVRVVMNYNLRWPKEAVQSNDWTVFVNAKGNLAHAVLYERDDVMVRLPGLSLKGCSDGYAAKVLLARLEGL